MNFKQIKKNFKIFKKKINNNNFIYFDSASTSQMPTAVLNEITKYYNLYKSNIGRAIYKYAEDATLAYNNSRKKIAHFINSTEDEIVFTSGTTAGINLIIKSWVDKNCKKNDVIIVSDIEHHSNFIPWLQISKLKNLNLIILPVNENGALDFTKINPKILRKTKLISTFHISNILGSKNNFETLTKLKQKYSFKLFIDAAQSIVHQKINVKELDCDFLAFSGHKLFGPTGIGALYIKKEIHSELTITQFGGGMTNFVSYKEFSPKPFPEALEPGTPQIAQAIGLAAAIDFIDKNIDFKLLANHETELVKLLIKQLEKIPSIKIISFKPKEFDFCSIVTFYSTKIHAHDIAAYLDSFGIAVRAGNHCVQQYHQKLRISASVRVSFSVYNSKSEVIFFIKKLKELINNN